MATSIQAGFQIGNNEPADARISVANQTARLGFASDNVYEGLVVYQKDTDKLYVLVDASDHTDNSNWSEVVISGGGGTNLSGIFSGSFSGSFEGDGSGLTGVAPAAGAGIFVNGTTVSVDSASLATDMAGNYLTAANGTLGLATSIGSLDETSFTGSFSGSFTGDGSGLTDIDAATAAQASKVETQTTTSTNTHFLTFVDSNNDPAAGELLYTATGINVNPANGGITATSVTASFKGDLDGNAATATVAQRNGNAQEHHIVFSLSTGSGEQLYADKDFKYTPATDGLTVGSVTASFKGDLDGNAATATTATSATSATNAESASHAADAFDTVSVTNATITLTDMAGNNSSGTVNNVSNATTALNATNATNANNISVDQSTEDTEFNITFTEYTTGYASLLVDNNGKLTYNPSTDVLTVGSTLSVGASATVGSNLTVTGDLIVNGTTTTLNTTNLEVEDAFILLNSGSSLTGDSGIIFGGSEGVASSGSALIWDGSYRSNTGRLRVATGIASSATSPIDTESIAYSIAGVFEGTEVDAANKQANHAGNIRIETVAGVDEIFIYA